eukprot:Gregarina_sp_Pseudo_9__3959@NODE_4102_length_486_cov_13_727069_g3773_i0_p1_GENE_NODE_4102_length_486_cov_13_727069_g3773_i0NODE_4102_length_486_cov_13_727069_g3773_i0_p1_ORF_typecomplete_len135_score8_38_NODE_4102_length_486_cov_13_727069_g3773_i044448
MASNLLRTTHYTDGHGGGGKSCGHPQSILHVIEVRDLSLPDDFKAICVEVEYGQTKRRSVLHRIHTSTGSVKVSESFPVQAGQSFVLYIIGKSGRNERMLGQSQRIDKMGFCVVKMRDPTGAAIALVDVNKTDG